MLKEVNFDNVAKLRSSVKSLYAIVQYTDGEVELVHLSKDNAPVEDCLRIALDFMHDGSLLTVGKGRGRVKKLYAELEQKANA